MRIFAVARLILVATALGSPFAAPAGAEATDPALLAASMSDDGLHTQTWFLNSFLDLAEDLEETRRAGKRLALIWEQRACVYCRDMHVINFAEPEISGFVRQNFNIVQLNLFGAREVTDFDGQVLTEKALARKWGIVATPTIQYFPASVGEVAGRSGRDAEVARMPGYFRPPTFLAMFQYVRDGRYAHSGFSTYVAERREQLRKAGADTSGW